MNLMPFTTHGVDSRDFITFRAGYGRTMEIVDIVVGSERRKGIGKRLIQSMLAEIRHSWPDTTMVYAVTRAGNTIAHQFYESQGFRIVGRLHYFYRDVDDRGCGVLEHALVYGLDI